MMPELGQHRCGHIRVDDRPRTGTGPARRSDAPLVKVAHSGYDRNCRVYMSTGVPTVLCPARYRRAVSAATVARQHAFSRLAVGILRHIREDLIGHMPQT